MASIEVPDAQAFYVHRYLHAKARKLGRTEEADRHALAARTAREASEKARVEAIVKETTVALSSKWVTEADVRDAIKLRAEGNPICCKKGRKRAGGKVELLHNFLDLAQQS